MGAWMLYVLDMYRLSKPLSEICGLKISRQLKLFSGVHCYLCQVT